MNYLSNKMKICISVTIPYMQTKLLWYIIMYLPFMSIISFTSYKKHMVFSKLFPSQFPGTSPGTYIGLDLRTRLYLGGVDPDGRLPDNVDVQSGFYGCVAEVSNKGRNTVEWFWKQVFYVSIKSFCGSKTIVLRKNSILKISRFAQYLLKSPG